MRAHSSFLSLPGAQGRFLRISLWLKASTYLLLTDKGWGVTRCRLIIFYPWSFLSTWFQRIMWTHKYNLGFANKKRWGEGERKGGGHRSGTGDLHYNEISSFHLFIPSFILPQTLESISWFLNPSPQKACLPSTSQHLSSVLFASSLHHHSHSALSIFLRIPSFMQTRTLNVENQQPAFVLS